MSVTGCKEQFKSYKSEINIGKISYGAANHILNLCGSSLSKFEYLQVQLIEEFPIQNDGNISKDLWEREKYWYAQIITLSRE